MLIKFVEDGDFCDKCPSNPNAVDEWCRNRDCADCAFDSGYSMNGKGDGSFSAIRTGELIQFLKIEV